MEPASYALQHQLQLQLQEFTEYYSIPQNEYRDNYKSSVPRLGNIRHVCDSIISNWDDQRTESSTHSMDISPTLYKESINMRAAGQGYGVYEKHFTSQLYNDFLPAKVMHSVPDNFPELVETIHSSSSQAPELLPVEELSLSSPDFFSGRNMKGHTVAEHFIKAPDTSNNGRVCPRATASTRSSSLPFVSLSPQVQDMFTSASYDRIFCQIMSYDTHDLQGGSTVPSYPCHSDSSIRGGTHGSTPSNNSSKVISGTCHGRPKNYKRSTSFETKDSSAENSKKTKSSCPPLKVRKEKMGDRISALHRLVAPFGKTDTASVLTEAIGYIQFLQDQIQKLSVPYMTRSSQSKPMRSVHQVAEESTQPKRDLRSRGLCVVPLSFASCFNGCA